MKIFTAENIRKADDYTIQNEPISSVQLMERAALSCADWISVNCKQHTKFVVFCGNGNNGGDGFAVARMLYLKGFDVDVFINKDKVSFSDDALINYKRLKDISGISVKDFSEIEKYNFEKAVIIDALFGTGLSGNLQGIYKDLTENLSLKNNPKISIDIPSGMFADQLNEKNDVIFKADYTLTFQFWKKTFLHPETGKFAGKVFVLDIKLSCEFIDKTESDDFVIDDNLILKIFKPREDFTHKGTYGKSIIVGGSYGKIGAAVLATKSALKTGSGLTFVLAPYCGYEILQTSSPEAMFIAGGEKNITQIDEQENAVYGIGPGLGTEKETEKTLLKFLENHKSPLILDADALNMISKNENHLKLIPKKSIITPHPKEFERLFGKTENSFKRLKVAKTKAKQFGFYIVLKDHHTQVVNPEGKVFYNITGNSGLAKGGSGDILTGIITSLLAQKYSSEDAAILGVWLHGKAADLAAEKHSKEAMQPTDVIDEIGNVFLDLNQKATTLL
ncbi:bifunctional ADP-dependent (S)-NAD(P)H-hydrate dehydratase/NAD(P)H-hydrate epimerase [Chryseobacterium sp. CBo1]|uniref:bifunctional ADP-dependent NAD(P)H-hydrate dehydratase/NAD(P)H-hydrate epimerase n=1 Tax=Chryseobacterium sp. CBo1 TaxID=1869230 RepID=UPI00081070AD|nr:bifunctional ADP-dependent NAD(P)H-hydrate dehydratase/NAD(P)H-hydrate epimerase [Chryseobacterium sp. CBo1]OCK50327.1 bifunctional ADP-dependent (S)-NAD(P)H-hydrate dehydratase/NAD(P)H-hydrate epimerase [Chryseobacterium sp. CBo1]